MNRLPLSVAALPAALMPLLVDSTLKGAALLAVAALCALALFRASAATRHLVWLVAVVALLVVPVLSVSLPQWRVLPAWTAVLQGTEGTKGTERTAPIQPDAAPASREMVPAPLPVPLTSPGHPQPPGALPTASPFPSVPSVPFVSFVPSVPSTHPLLPLAWLAGCALLSLRLLAAHLLLRRAARRCRVLTEGAPLAAAFEAVRAEMGFGPRVTLLLDERRTIPVVWGLFRPRLLLPAEAREWGADQLRSVFLHELAHLKRRDPLVQWLTQIACALHWWNPLVWLAAWRIHVERERACDDLVLARGVRPSAYAEHLLHVATKLSPARWTESCGLAMARKSSLEGRLLAVLSEKLNRQGVTSALAASALLLGAGIAIPVAMLRAADHDWNPPQAAHIGTNDFSAYCVHNGKVAAFVIAYLGESGSSSTHDSNSQTRTWTDSGTLTAKQPGIALTFHRSHTAPGKLSITTAPAEGRDLSQPAPAPRDFGQNEYDLADGRVFLLTDSGVVRQLDLPTPVVTNQESAKTLATLIADVPPQERDDVAPPRHTVGPLAPETIAKLNWGEPVNGLRMALAWPPSLNDPLLGTEPVFELVVQNLAENEVHFIAGDDAPNPRKLLIREGESIVQALSDPEVSAADWKLQPGQCGVLRLFTNEERDPGGTIPSSAIESDLSKIGRYHAIVRMEIAKAPAGAWTGMLVTGQTRGSADLPMPGARLTLEMLEGIWAGERDGVNFEIRYPWSNEHQQASWRIWRIWKGGSNLGLDTSVVFEDDAARLIFRKGLQFEHGYGHLTAGNGGGLLLDVTPNPHVTDQSIITAQKGIVLTRQPGETRLAPKHKDARALYEIWQRHARANGDIPGAFVGELAGAVRTFIGYNPTWETVPKLNELLPRLDATRDWSAVDAIALLDELAGVQDSPVVAAAERATRRTIRQGTPMPEMFADAAWGETQPNGLRAAWVLEPDAEAHRMGAALKARLLVWNSGPVPVMLRVPTWHQGEVLARDATDAEVQVSGISWTTLAQLVPVRLGPGETIEINTPGVGLGPRAGMGPWAGPRGGSNVLANPGDALTLTHGPVPVDGSDVGVREDDPHVVGPGWWLAHIKARLSQELPLPADAAERARLLDRAVRELFATAPTAEETAAFTGDHTPDALDALVERLAARADVVEFSGKLPTAPAAFRVVAADPNADKMPRVVLGPGEYPLSAGTAEYGAVTLKIVGRPVGDRRTNDAQLLFEPTEFTGKLPPDPHKLMLPDGWGTWAIVCRPGEKFFYLLRNRIVRKIDFTNPLKVTDTPANDLPAEFRDEVKRQLEIHGVSAEQQAEVMEQPAPPAATPVPEGAKLREAIPLDELDKSVEWNAEETNGLRLGIHIPNDTVWKADAEVKAEIWVHNASETDVRFSHCSRTDVGLSVIAKGADGKEHFADITQFRGKPGFSRLLLPAGNVVKLKEFTMKLGAKKDGERVNLDLPPGDYKLRAVWSDTTSRAVPEGEWSGEITTGEVSFKLNEANAGAEAEMPAAKPPGANIVKLPDDQYVKSGGPADELAGEGVTWNETQNGLSLGYRITGDEWRLLGKEVKMELWVRNPGDKDVKFQLNMRPDIGLRLRMKNETGEELESNIVPTDVPPFGEHRLLPPGHALKVKEAIIVSLLRPENDVSGIGGHFFTLNPGAYDFKCELELPGFSATGEGGKQITPAEGEWTGKLTTRALKVTVFAPEAPKEHAKLDAATDAQLDWGEAVNGLRGTAGGLVSGLHDKVKEFIRNNEPDPSGGPYARKMKPLEPRFDVEGDWKPADVVALLDDIAAAHPIPLDNALTHLMERTLQAGTPLPASLENADWGEPQPSGLRVAHVLEPRAEAYPLGTELKARIVFHNAGSEPVTFITDTFQQPKHAAKRADGGELTLDSTEWLTLGSMAAYRLAPGEHCEVHTPGLGIGARAKDRDDWENVRAGSWILCAEGDEVTFTPGPAELGYRETPEQITNWWHDFITERLNREAPVPTDTKEREYLLYRVVRDLFGTAPSTTEGDAFAADRSPDALKNLAALLAKHPYGKRSDGVIRAGRTTFRVLPPDPGAATRPRVANGPGTYSLGDGVYFSVTRRSHANTVVNEASIGYYQQGKDAVAHNVPLPEGHDTWAAATMKGAPELWIAEAGILRKYDFASPLQPLETRYEGDKAAEAPISGELREALDPVLSKHPAEVPKRMKSTPPPAAEMPSTPATG